jgi:hypothetical protein
MGLPERKCKRMFALEGWAEGPVGRKGAGRYTS